MFGLLTIIRDAHTNHAQNGEFIDPTDISDDRRVSPKTYRWTDDRREGALRRSIDEDSILAQCEFCSTDCLRIFDEPCPSERLMRRVYTG